LLNGNDPEQGAYLEDLNANGAHYAEFGTSARFNLSTLWQLLMYLCRQQIIKANYIDTFRNAILGNLYGVLNIVGF
jgi:hypothetical protein